MISQAETMKRIAFDFGECLSGVFLSSWECEKHLELESLFYAAKACILCARLNLCKKHFSFVFVSLNKYSEKLYSKLEIFSK